MRRVNLFLTMLVLAALLLAACGGEQTSTSLPSTNVPPVTIEATEATEAPVSTETTGTSESTGPDTTTTPAVPVTGGDSLSRVTNLIGSSICGMGGDQLGSVQDLVLDFDQTMVTYAIVDANGRNVAVPWTSLTVSSGGGTGAGSGTGSQADATATTTGGTGTDATATSTTGGSSGGTESGTTDQQSCLALTVDDDTFNNAPDFDQTTMPMQGQSAAGWDADIQGYWANPGAGGAGTTTTETPSAGGTGGLATDTPSVGADSTAMPDTTATADTGAGAGTGQGTGAQQMQGVMLATDVLGASVTVSPQGNDQGAGSGTDNASGTSTPSVAAVSTDTPSAGGTSATATSDTGTGTGSGTGTGDFSQGTVEDIIIEPQTGDMQYLVVSFGTQESWFPVPIGFLNWDSTTNGIVLMINQNALQNAPTFSPEQFPDTSMSGWDQEWSTYWQNNGGTSSGGGTGSGGVSVSTATATP